MKIWISGFLFWHPLGEFFVDAVLLSVRRVFGVFACRVPGALRISEKS